MTEVFKKLIPFAAEHDTRLVLVNRRDFPGSDPYDDDDRHRIAAISDAPDGMKPLQSFMSERARELYDFLAAYVKQENIPPARGITGGIILVSWSWGAVWLTAFVANLKSFPMDVVNLRQYVRRIVLYGESPVMFCSLRAIDKPVSRRIPQIHRATLLGIPSQRISTIH